MRTQHRLSTASVLPPAMAGVWAAARVPLGRADLLLVIAANRSRHGTLVPALMRAASRLGDGWAWAGLAFTLGLLHGPDAARPILQMAASALGGGLLYRWVKGATGRPRPYEATPEVVAGAAALDRFSFPSGHTLHAVAFTTIAVSHFGDPWAWILMPLASAIALSRVTLGLHYPSDVVAGGTAGWALAQFALRAL